MNSLLVYILIALAILGPVLLGISHSIILKSSEIFAPEKVVFHSRGAHERKGSAVGVELQSSIVSRKSVELEEKEKNGVDHRVYEKTLEAGKDCSRVVSVYPKKWDNLTVRTDPVPGGCRHSFAIQSGDFFLSCGHEMLRLLSENASSIEEAAGAVAKQYPDGCRRCNEARQQTAFPYFRYDDVAPPVHASATHFLRSIPDEWRVPESGFGNLTRYLQKSAEESPDRQYLYEFNPSIIALPPHHRPGASGGEDQPTYLASYRLSHRKSYVGHLLADFLGKDEERDRKARDLLGLAFLRNDLSIVQDVVISLQDVRCIMEDARLFLLNDTVYVGTNDRLIALHVETADQHPSDLSFKYKVNNVFASPLVVTVMHKYRTCAFDSIHAKNVNYFTDERDGSVLAEMWPSNPHEVVPISLDMQPNCHGLKVDVERDVIVDGKHPKPSFATLEELHFPKMRPRVPLLTPRPRGTTCCVSLTHDGRKFLVGVSHDKTPYSRRRAQLSEFHPNHFLSQFYAFEPRAPYPVIARSGYFCMGFPSLEHDDGLDLHPALLNSTKWDTLWFRERFDCPKIHFVSGMAEAVDDPDMVILAYGVNDFLSRFVKVSKHDIATLLFDHDLENVRGTLRREAAM